MTASPWHSEVTSLLFQINDVIERCTNVVQVHVYLAACELFLDGATAIFGPMSVTSGGHIQSMCDHLAIPHMDVRWDSQFYLDPQHFAVNLHPHHSTLARAYTSFLVRNNWKKFTILYDESECKRSLPRHQC